MVYTSSLSEWSTAGTVCHKMISMLLLLTALRTVWRSGENVRWTSSKTECLQFLWLHYSVGYMANVWWSGWWYQVQPHPLSNPVSNQKEIMSLNLSPINHLEELAKNHTNKSNIECKFFESAGDVPDPRDLRAEKKSHHFRRPPVKKTEQMRGLLHQKSSQQRNVDCFYLAQN